MLSELDSSSVSVEHATYHKWLSSFHVDFKRRFIALLSSTFPHFTAELGLNILKSNQKASSSQKSSLLTLSELQASQLFLQYDLKRLESYAKNLVDYHMILDLVPSIARLYFTDRLGLAAAKGQVSQYAFSMSLAPHSRVDGMNRRLVVGFQ